MAAMSGAAPAGTNAGAAAAPSLLRQRTGTEEIKVIGVRRVIAQRMTEAARTIPHFSYVEEVDVTELESLRTHLNSKAPKGDAAAHLPAVPRRRAGARARRVSPVQRALRRRARRADPPPPRCTSAWRRRRRTASRCRSCATPKPARCWDLAAEIRRVSEAAQGQQGLARGTQRLDDHHHQPRQAGRHRFDADHQRARGGDHRRQQGDRASGRPRRRHRHPPIMNLSSSFDHRFVDGYDAAAMIQALKDLLEHPATIFIPG